MQRAVWIAVAVLAGCAVDADETDSIDQEVVTRNALEKNFDGMLGAIDGRGCDIENGRQFCVATTAVTPQRTLRIGDAIPSAQTLRLCSGGACNLIVTPPQPPVKWTCSGLAACAPLGVGCLPPLSLICHPQRSPFPGFPPDLVCNCEDVGS